MKNSRTQKHQNLNAINSAESHEQRANQQKRKECAEPQIQKCELGDDWRATSVGVPDGWDEGKDRDYVFYCMPELEDSPPKDRRAMLVARIDQQLEDFHGALSFAIAFLTGKSYDPDSDIFRFFPVEVKVAHLQKLFRERCPNENQRERFRRDLDKFLEVQKVCIPILKRYLDAPTTVWLRELLDLHDSLSGSVFILGESMACELDGCPDYVGAYHIEPALR